MPVITSIIWYMGDEGETLDNISIGIISREDDCSHFLQSYVSPSKLVLAQWTDLVRGVRGVFCVSWSYLHLSQAFTFLTQVVPL